MSSQSGWEAGEASLKKGSLAGHRAHPLFEEPAKPFAGEWDQYFHQRHSDAGSVKARRLDYSNDPVRFQTYGALLESAGPLTGVPTLDAGCGFGDLARLLDAGGAQVDAFDVVDETVRDLAKSHPRIRWFAADVSKLTPEVVPTTYGLVVAAEVLQYAEPVAAIQSLFRFVAPGGRLVGCIPHAGCPIVGKAVGRYSGHYWPMTIPGLVDTLASLPGIREFAWRGAIFTQEQGLNPYRLTPWYRTAEMQERGEVPNRLHFVAAKVK